MQASNSRNLLILSFALVVVTIGFGIVMPIIPFYVEDMGAGGTELGLLVASYALMRLIFGPIWGSLSDRIGRKPVMMIGVLGYGITMIGFGLATRLWMMFAARILSGVLSSATAPTTMAFIGDSTAEEDRARGMGMLGAAAGVGTILGPAMGGLLADRSLSFPFFVAAGMSFLSLILIAVFLPESLKESDRTVASSEGLNLDPRAWLSALRGPIGPFLVLAFLVTGALTTFFGIFGLYALERFGLGTAQVGLVFSVLGLVMVLGQGLLVGPITGRFGEIALVRAGFALSAAGLLLVMLATEYVWLVATIGLFSLLIALLTPSISSLTSKRTTMSQGVTMGLSNSFGSLGRIVGPLLGGLAFDFHWGLSFLCGAVMMLAGWLVSLRWVQGEPVAEPEPRSAAT